MNPRIGIVFVILLAILIAVLTWFLLVTPASAPSTSSFVSTSTPATTTNSGQKPPTTSSPSVPLDKSVTVTTPAANATVGQTFTVAGTAPGAWFSEATFPIQVRDSDDNVVGRVGASAQGDWQTSGLVTFTATVTVDPSFHGAATLILNRDNPSGLPENDDSVTVPIVVQ